MNAGGAEVRIGRNAPRRNGLRLDKDFEVSDKCVLRCKAVGRCRGAVFVLFPDVAVECMSYCAHALLMRSIPRSDPSAPQRFRTFAFREVEVVLLFACVLLSDDF